MMGRTRTIRTKVFQGIYLDFFKLSTVLT